MSKLTGNLRLYSPHFEKPPNPAKTVSHFNFKKTKLQHRTRTSNANLQFLNICKLNGIIHIPLDSSISSWELQLQHCLRLSAYQH